VLKAYLDAQPPLQQQQQQQDHDVLAAMEVGDFFGVCLYSATTAAAAIGSRNV
jgi:hypothetical protein